MTKKRSPLDGTAILLVLSVMGLATSSLFALHSVKPITQWIEAVFHTANDVSISTFNDIVNISTGYWFVTLLFAVCATTSAASYVAVQQQSLTKKGV